MIFNKYKNDSYWVGGRNRSATLKFYGDLTNKGSKVLIGFCSICIRKQSMTVSDNTIKAEGLGSLFKNLRRISAKASRKLLTNVFKKPSRALEIGANVATAASSRSPQAALSTIPEVMNFYHKGRGLCLGKFVYIMLYKWLHPKFISICTIRKHWFRTNTREKIKWC